MMLQYFSQIIWCCGLTPAGCSQSQPLVHADSASHPFIKKQPVTGEELKQEQKQICSWVGRMGVKFLSESLLNYRMFFFDLA